MKNIRTILEFALGQLPEEDLNALVNAVTTSQHQAGSIICREGDEEYILYIIHEGSVAFTKKMESDEQLLGIKGSGEFFGELSLIDHAPRAATVHAVTDCRLIEIHEQTFDYIISRNPSAAKAIMRGITSSMRATDQITIASLQLNIDELARANKELAKTLEELRAAQAELLRRERMKRDLEIAAAVHKGILPTAFPSVPNFEFAALARPAREIGGDLYDVIDMDEGHAAIVMADASGKSVQAAIYMAIVKTLFLSQAQSRLTPAEIAHRVHNLLLRASSAEMFVTVFYAHLNWTNRQLTFIRGGHDRPVFYRAATQTTQLLEPAGRFLGLLPDLFVQEDRLVFETGDVLVCYSDGVTDATATDGESMYGIERLRTAIEANAARFSAQELVNFIVDDVDRFRDGAEQPDDLTLLVTKAV